MDAGNQIKGDCYRTLAEEPPDVLRIADTDLHLGFPVGSVIKIPSPNAGATRDGGSIPESGRSPGAGIGSPLQYSCLENSMDRGAWRATIHWIARKSDTTENTCTFATEQLLTQASL